MKVIRNIEEARRYKRGWTYVLLSENKRTMKIGHAIPDVARRIYQHQHSTPYNKYNFQLILAIDNAKYERILHDHFDEYRSCYKWLEGDNYGQHFTKSEAHKLAYRLFKKERSTYKFIDNAFCQNVMKTRNELFNIPPQKIGSKLESIIQQVLNF